MHHAVCSVHPVQVFLLWCSRNFLEEVVFFLPVVSSGSIFYVCGISDFGSLYIDDDATFSC